ncbi:hypothetical protein V7121_22660 [Neobacillus drentensis]
MQCQNWNGLKSDSRRIHEAKTIKEYWQTVNMAAFSYSLELELHHILDVAIQSFKQLIRKLKFNRNVKNSFAYFYGIDENKFCVLFHDILSDKYDLNDVNWSLVSD